MPSQWLSVEKRKTKVVSFRWIKYQTASDGSRSGTTGLIVNDRQESEQVKEVMAAFDQNHIWPKNPNLARSFS